MYTFVLISILFGYTCVNLFYCFFRRTKKDQPTIRSVFLLFLFRHRTIDGYQPGIFGKTLEGIQNQDFIIAFFLRKIR